MKSEGLEMKEVVKKHVVVVDDDPHFRVALGDAVESRGHDVKGFDGVSLALDYLKGNRVDLIITDFKLIGRTGLELVVKVRELYPETRIALVTGVVGVQSVFEAVGHSADYLIAKPIREEELDWVLKSLG